MILSENLIIITEGHPHIDTHFIYPELLRISPAFKTIIVYPVKWENVNREFVLPENIIINRDLSVYISRINPIKKKFYGLFSGVFLRHFIQTSPLNWKSLVNTCGFAMIFSKWILSIKPVNGNTLFYTYWLTLPAVGLALLRGKCKIHSFVSRAHGYDLYNERGDKILNLLKPYIFSNLDALYCISEHGKRYLEERYPHHQRKFILSRLGTENHNIPNCNKGERLEIVSCSFIVPVKRIELLVAGISHFQKSFPQTDMRWTHIGGGDGLQLISRICSSRLKPGTYNLVGHREVSQILDYYSVQYFDCFINVSRHEGLPVSIMEAQSAGIPVIATNVGGTSEIVNEINGFLLKPDPTPEEISDALYQVIQDNSTWKRKRSFSRENWERYFNADNNYNDFIKNLELVIQ